MKNNIVETITKSANKTALVIRKHSPEILIVVGAIGTVTAAVMACKATLKVEAVLDDTKEKLDKCHLALETKPEVYSQEDYKKDVTSVYVNTGIQFAKLYGPAITLGTLSMGTMFASNNILRTRNASLTAAFATVDTAFKKYRSNVVDEFGKEVDFRLRHGIKSQEIEVVEVDEKGKEKTVKKTVDVISDDYVPEYSEFARFFDEGCSEWDKNPEYNLTLLRAKEAWANQRLKTKGFLFLNEVYEELGIPQTKAGQMVGWLYEDDGNPESDGYVDFGIYEMHRPNRDFVNGYNNTILLDFNVDGVIYDKI